MTSALLARGKDSVHSSAQRRGSQTSWKAPAFHRREYFPFPVFSFLVSILPPWGRSLGMCRVTLPMRQGRRGPLQNVSQAGRFRMPPSTPIVPPSQQLNCGEGELVCSFSVGLGFVFLHTSWQGLFKVPSQKRSREGTGGPFPWGDLGLRMWQAQGEGRLSQPKRRFRAEPSGKPCSLQRNAERLSSSRVPRPVLSADTGQPEW